MNTKIELKKYREVIYLSDEVYKDICCDREVNRQLMEEVHPLVVLPRVLEDISDNVNLTEEQLDFFSRNLDAHYEIYRDVETRRYIHETRVYLEVPEHFIEEIYKLLNQYIE